MSHKISEKKFYRGSRRPYGLLTHHELSYALAQARKLDDASQVDALLEELDTRVFQPKKPLPIGFMV